MNNIDTIIDKAINMGCQVIKNEELKKYTTFRIGGKCDCLIKINGTDTCKELVSLVKKNGIPYYVLGKGSNLIIDDFGINGIVFLFGNEFSNSTVNDDIITCEAGLSLSKLCNLALDNSLCGLEFAYGIPGTVGGAVFMNAGAYGGEIKDVIFSVDALDSNGSIISIPAENLDLSYRNSIFMHNEMIILNVTFKLSKGISTEIKTKMDNFMEKRRTNQPLEYPSAGSTFKRPAGSYASLLIDQCELKGFSIGDAEVSTKHAGFVINKGNASFEDVMLLIQKVKDIVKDKTGYVIECEPEIITDREEFFE